MAASGRARSEDQFLCPICLEMFTDPVSTPCGHNYCKHCITGYWKVRVPCQCPMCKEVFYTRPQLKINTFISEMVAQFRREAQQGANGSSSEQQAAKPEEVPCDVCTKPRLKALKSCLVCLASYCYTHLEPHLTAAPLKIHQLIDPVQNLADRMCMRHNKPLELFCKTDQSCVCMLCSVLDHKDHEFVPLKEEYEGKRAELKRTETEIQQMIQQRRLKMQEIKHSVDLSKKAADRETAEGVQVFTALMEPVQKSLNELIEEIEERQRTTEKQAADFIKQLEQEISELKNRSTEAEQLSSSEDHLHFLQRFTSVKPAPPMKASKKVSIRPPSYEGAAVRAVSQLEGKLRGEMKKLLVEAELRRVQQDQVDVTLDPDRADPELILSDENKQVRRGHGGMLSGLFDNLYVLGKQSFTSGRFYFEVQVKSPLQSDWSVGVASESISRKDTLFGSLQDVDWTIGLRNGSEYRALGRRSVLLSLKSRPQKVGVFVDYEKGLVSFYDVDTAALIYSFTGCRFTEKLFPYLSLCGNDGGKNSATLIITPVTNTE